MDVEGDLVAGGVAAVADDLDVAFLLHGRVGAGAFLAPELDLHDVGLQVVQHQVPVQDGLELFKQRVVLHGIVGGHLALLLVAVDDHRGLAQDVLLLFHIGGHFGGILLQVAAQAAVAVRLGAEGRVEVVGHVFAFDLQNGSSFGWGQHSWRVYSAVRVTA